MSNIERAVVVDSQVAGVSGDMFLGALVNLGTSTTKISEALKVAKDNLRGCKDLQLKVRSVTRNGIHAQKADIIFQEEVSERTGSEIRKAVIKTSQSLELSPRAQQFVLNTVETLIDAEKKIHGESNTDLHFAELGSADTVADIIGVAVALEDLSLFDNTMIYATPVAVGTGNLKFSHGIVSIPAPATLEILRAKNFPIISGPVVGELATPTGVSLLVNLAHKVTSAYPSMKPIAVGYGAGAKEFTEMANVLRVTIGEPVCEDLLRDKVYVLETNLDDVPGEVIGYTVDKLLREGARDFSIIPIFTKKNRPGQMLHVITDEDKIKRLSQILIEETGTLGVRFFPCQRYVLERESIQMDVKIKGIEQKAYVKVARNKRGRIVRVKPEYEDVKMLAEKTGKPFREISRLMQKEIRDALARQDQTDRG